MTDKIKHTALAAIVIAGYLFVSDMDYQDAVAQEAFAQEYYSTLELTLNQEVSR